MQNYRHHSYICLLLVLLVTTFIGIGCTENNLSNCPKFSHQFIVKAYHADGTEVVENGVIKDLNVYVFDQNETFLALHKVEIGNIIQLDYLAHEKLNIVVLANSESENQKRPKLKVGDKIDDAYISLITQTKSLDEIAVSPDDLFKGRQEIIKNRLSENAPPKISLQRKVASVVITTNGIKEYAITTSDDFHYILRYGKREFNLKGETSEDNVTHKPVSNFNNKLLESSIFNIIPSQDNIEVDIYNGTKLITTISKDDKGNLLKAKEGELLNIYASFIGDVSVSIEVTEWGKKVIWKEF